MSAVVIELQVPDSHVYDICVDVFLVNRGVSSSRENYGLGGRI